MPDNPDHLDSKLLLESPILSFAMSYIFNDDITQYRFASLPSIGSLDISPVEQAAASLDAASTVAYTSSKSDERGKSCLIKGNIDIAHEWAHFITPVRKTEQEPNNRVIEDFLIDELNIIPSNQIGIFTLEDASNSAWLTPYLRRHHDIFATIMIAPCLDDLRKLTHVYKEDNDLRQEVIDSGKQDYCRPSIDMLLNVTNLQKKFELVVLHPSHFHVGGEPMSALFYNNNDSLQRTLYYNTHSDGLLYDSDGNFFPSFSPRYDRAIDLNPILVNIAAAIRVRRFKRMNNDTFPTSFHQHAIDVMNAVLELHEAVVFRPRQPPEGTTDADASDEETTSLASASMIRHKPLPADVWKRLQSGDVDANDVDIIFGGHDFQDLPDLGIEDDPSSSNPLHSTPNMSLKEKMRLWTSTEGAGLM